MESVTLSFFFLILVYIQKRKKHRDSQQYQFFWGAFTFWPAYKQSCAFPKIRRRKTIKTKKKKKKKKKLDASALAQKQPRRKLGGGGDGETMVSFLGCKATPRPF